MAEPFRLTIEELTGARRSITLSGRSLPYQNVSFETVQRTKQSWFGANPQGSIQVLGPEFPNTELRGMWKDKFIQGSVEATGFDFFDSQSIVAQVVVDCMESIVQSGNQVRVTLGPRVRQGVFKRFRPTYVRAEDIEWEMEFEWSTQTYTAPPGATAPAATTDELRADSNAVSRQMARIPTTCPPKFVALVDLQVLPLQSSYIVLNTAMATAANEVTLAESTALLAVTTAQQMRRDSALAASALNAQSYSACVSTYSDTHLASLEVDLWRRQAASTQRTLAVDALRASLDLQAQVKPGKVIVVTVGEGMTLRHLALRYLGSADAWPRIAEANDLNGSVVPVGSTVKIPLTPQPRAQ